MDPHAFLVAHWEGGGNTPPVFAVIRRLVGRGHRVHVLSDLCHRDEVVSMGATFSAWRSVPARPDRSPQYEPLKDWEVSSPIARLGRIRDRMMVGVAAAYARDVLDELLSFNADVVVTAEMLLGVMAAAESAGIPCVALSPNIYFYPLPGVPPFGPGLMPRHGVVGRLRDRLVQTVTTRVIGRGTPLFNDLRESLGLRQLSHPFEQLQSLARHLVLTSAAFDFRSTALPQRVVYAGPELEDPSWVDGWRSPFAAGDRRPLVLVGFSTTFQKQEAALGRVVVALGELAVRAVVTTGPAVDPRRFAPAPNVHLCASAPHGQLLRETSVAITHAGHGTVIRALAAGVPLLCMPMGRDQNDNAARVVARGAGLRLPPTATATQVRRAVSSLLTRPAFRARAQELARRINDDALGTSAVTELEQVASVMTGEPVYARP